MKDLKKKLDEAADSLSQKVPQFPKQLVVLGSGLGELCNEMDVEAEVPYDSIPHVPRSTVQGHQGKLLVGKLNGVSVACMQGRVHYYEGYSMGEVVFPFRLFARMGAEIFTLTNAAGGVHSDMASKELLLIQDHINLMGSNPLIGPNDDSIGPRFPDLSDVYDHELQEIARKSAKKVGVALREGVYLAISGPSYETASEVRAYRQLGADVVGMSTVPEAVALKHMGKRVVGISCITNLATGVGPRPVSHDDVMALQKEGLPHFGGLIRELVARIGGVLGA